VVKANRQKHAPDRTIKVFGTGTGDENTYRFNVKPLQCNRGGTLQTIKESLIQQAEKKFGDILPINGESFRESHFIGYKQPDGNELIVFWFNTPDGSTHMVKVDKNCPQCFGELANNHCACERRGI